MANEITKTTNELAKELNVSIRMVQLMAKALKINKVKGKYIFSEKQAKAIANEFTNENERTSDNQNIVEEFTPEQYEKLQEVIENYKQKVSEAKHLLEQAEIYKNQLEYMRQSLSKKDDQIQELIKAFQKTIQTTSERNHLEYLKAIEKRQDNEKNRHL